MTPIRLLILLLALAICLPLFAHDGDLDPSFNGSGKLTFAARPGVLSYDGASAVAIQSDGKIVIVGSTYTVEPPSSLWTAARLNPDGTFDSSFGTAGRVAFNLGFQSTSSAALALALQDDGKIVLGGYSQYNLAIVRLNADGSKDPSFANGGVWLGNPVGGQTQPYVTAMSLIAQPAGGQLIVFAGAAPTTGGSSFLRGFIDSTGQFPHMDLIAGPNPYSGFYVMVAQGAKFVMLGQSYSVTTGAGVCSSRRYRLGYSTIGVLQFFPDSSFTATDVPGASATPQCYIDDAALLPNGDLAISGDQSNNGSGDIAFAYGLNGGDGSVNDRKLVSPFAVVPGANTGIVAQTDGKVVFASTTGDSTRSQFLLQRRQWLSGNQGVDPAYANAGTAVINFDHDTTQTRSSLGAITLDQDGRVVAVGSTRDVVGATSEQVAVVRLQGDVIFKNGFETN